MADPLDFLPGLLDDGTSVPPIGLNPFDPILPIPPIAPIAPIDAPQSPPPIKPTEKSKAWPFFLKPNNSVSNMEFRGAVRQATSVVPIIDGIEIFAELEAAITDAKESVLIAFWAFEPSTPLLSDDTKTWLDLIKEVATKGVMVRILMTDFDPGLDLQSHFLVWSRYRTLLLNTGSLPSDRVQIVCSHHEAETSSVIVKQVRPDLYDKLADRMNAVAASASSKRDFFLRVPGLWDKLDFDTASGKVTPKKAHADYPAWPAVHHKKLIIVDGKIAYTGGLNITSAYADSQQHDMLPNRPWHDAFVRAEGSLLLRDFVRAYVGLWNQERLRCESFLKTAYAALNLSVAPTIGPTSDLAVDKLMPKTAVSGKPKISSQVHRTITKKSMNPLGIPDVVRQDILEGYLQAIGQAQEFVYLENQYFRERAIADALIQRHKEKSALKVILLLPLRTEELEDGKTDEITLHGAALQYELLEALKNNLRDDFGAFAMQRKDKKSIYVHSKLCLIDDAFVSIGSANSNPRSYRMDTELDLVWYNESTASQLRFDLWNEILGNPAGLKTWKSKSFLGKWRAIAKQNLRSGAPKKGFVVPFENREKGKKNAIDLGPFT